MGQLALNLLSLLAIRNLCHVVPGILDQYGRLVDQHGGIERAEVISAVPLDDGQLSKVTKIVEELVGKSVGLTSRVQAEILGGLIVRVSDRVIDGSVRAALREMRRSVGEQA